MHEAAVEEVIGRSIWVCFVEAPSRLAFRVGTNDRDRQEGLNVLDVSDEVGAMSEGTEETCVCTLAL